MARYQKADGGEDAMSWEGILKVNKWVGFCQACKKWRNEQLSIKRKNSKGEEIYFCIRPINYYGPQGDAQMYVRENLANFDKLGWDRRKVNGRDVCGMELADGDEETTTDRDYTDFRGRGDIPGNWSK